MHIEAASPSDPRLADLLGLHLDHMRASSPPGRSFALDASGLAAPGVTFLAAIDGDRAIGMGALKRLSADHGEVKSMRTHPDALRRGVAATVLEAIIVAARAAGMTRLSLETGSGPAFEAAPALYRRRGFVSGPAFGTYEASDFNRFLHLDLGSQEPGRGGEGAPDGL